MKLKYPRAFIIRCLHKAKRIRRAPTQTQSKPKHRSIVVPGSSKIQAISKTLRKAGAQLVEKPGTKIGELIKGSNHKEFKDSVVYKVPCGGCSRSYFGETYRGVQKRMSEHKADIRHHRTTSSFVTHIESCQHLPDWKRTEVLWSGRDRSRRKMVEATVIETVPNINNKRGDYTLAPIFAGILWGDHIKGT